MVSSSSSSLSCEHLFIVEAGIAHSRSYLEWTNELPGFCSLKVSPNNNSIEQPLCYIGYKLKPQAFFFYSSTCTVLMVRRQRVLQVSNNDFSVVWFHVGFLLFHCFLLDAVILPYRIASRSRDFLLYACVCGFVCVSEWYRASVHQVTSHEVKNANVNYNYSGLTQMTDLHLTQFIAG